MGLEDGVPLQALPLDAADDHAAQFQLDLPLHGLALLEITAG